MCFGTTQNTTSTTTPAAQTPEQQEAQRLALESMRVRNSLLPYMLQQAGITMGPGGATSTPTPQMQAQNQLMATSYGGANQAAQLLMQRLGAGQSMVPALLQAVQATQPHYAGGGGGVPAGPSMTGTPSMGGGAGAFQMPPLQQFPPFSQPGAGSPISLPTNLTASSVGSASQPGQVTQSQTTGGGGIGSTLGGIGAGALSAGLLLKKLLAAKAAVPGAASGAVSGTAGIGGATGFPGLEPPPFTLPGDPSTVGSSLLGQTPFSGPGPGSSNLPPISSFPTPPNLGGAAAGIGGAGASSAGGLVFGPGVGGSIAPELLTGAGGAALAPGAGASVAGASDFLPSFLGGTGAALGPLAAFAAPVIMALMGQFAAGASDKREVNNSKALVNDFNARAGVSLTGDNPYWNFIFPSFTPDSLMGKYASGEFKHDDVLSFLRKVYGLPADLMPYAPDNTPGVDRNAQKAFNAIYNLFTIGTKPGGPMNSFSQSPWRPDLNTMTTQPTPTGWGAVLGSGR